VTRSIVDRPASNEVPRLPVPVPATLGDNAVEEISSLPAGVAPWYTVIVPTRNEAGNIEQLLRRLAASQHGAIPEVLFVDDSSDDTPAEIRRAGRHAGLAVRLLHRGPEDRTGGLGGAVMAGLNHAHGAWAVVMDGDLQHPPELASSLVAIGQSRGLDLVAATRKLDSGATDGLGGGYRRAVSGLATTAAKVMFPRKLARLSDPMSGFFAVRLAALRVQDLKPIGFKILMEIAVRNPHLLVAEVPFVFGDRLDGASKASAREGARFLNHLARLRFAVLKSQLAQSSTQNPSQRLRRLIAFGLVGASGLVVNTVALWWFHTQLLTGHYLLAATLATQVSTVWNFALTESLVFFGKKPGSMWTRGFKFFLLNNVALVLRLPMLALFVSALGVNLLVANVVTLVFLFLLRFVIADAAIYAPRPEVEKRPMRVVVNPSLVAAPPVNPVSEATAGVGSAVEPAFKPATNATPTRHRPGYRHLPYRYAIHDVLTIGSQVELPELEYFRAQWVGADVDLAVRIGKVGRSAPRARAQMTQYTTPAAIRYEEHLGRLGANFRVTLGEKVEVEVSSSLAHSPHVLYTNVIEALLRFIAVSRGVILLHSACLELDGKGYLLSARTDTGKTGTVLRMSRDYGANFLSDDMTIVDSTGRARCFPKPLTISHHTLRAVKAGDLTAKEWRRLKIQSRLHSKEGRDFAMLLARLNIPIMGFNALTQRIVPPPKYTVDRLVETTITRETQIENLFVIERGEPALYEIDQAEALKTLVINTDDAYGFPPFREMAPSIVIGEDDYLALRRKETEILTQAMSNVRARGIASDDFTWADRIAGLLGGTSMIPAATTKVAATMPGPAPALA
jgi:dolichol-phosphate mannosyltransferase